jgi:hypothetical protein
VFGDVASESEDPGRLRLMADLECESKKMAQRVSSLCHLLDSFGCVIIVGNPGSGKSLVRQTLKSILGKGIFGPSSSVHVQEHVFFPIVSQFQPNSKLSMSP